MKIFHLIINNIIIGYVKSKTNKSMKKYIIGNYNNLLIINIKKIIISILILKKYIKKLINNNEKILLIGTNNYFREIIYKYGRSLEQPFIFNKWIAGTLTNFKNLKFLLNKLILLKKKKNEKITKKEKNKILLNEKKLELYYGGLRYIKNLPKLIIITDVLKDKIIIKEAKRLDIKIAGFCDTYNNIKGIDYIIPCNNGSIYVLNFLFKILFSFLC